MKFEIAREDLLRGVTRVQAIVDRRGTLPILTNALLEASDDGLRLTATDLEVGVVCTQKADVQKPGRVTLAAKKLHEIVRELDDARIVVTAEVDSRVRLETTDSRFSLMSMSADEYPTLPSAEGVEFVAIEAAILRDMIDRTFYATSSDETRYNLNGIFVELTPDEGRLSFVATDGHRLAKVERTVSADLDAFGKGVIVPRKGIAEIRKLCDETESRIEIALHDGFLLTRRPDLQLSCRLIDGEFPSYRQVLPRNQQIRLILDRERLMHAIRRVSLVASDRGSGFAFALDDDQIQLSASSPDLGEAHERLAVEYGGPRFETRFDARYFSEALQAIPSKEAVLELIDDLSPAQLRPADDPDQIAVIMPMRL